MGKTKAPAARQDGLKARKAQRSGRAHLDFSGDWGGELCQDLSAVCSIGRTLFLGADEKGSLERLVWNAERQRFDGHASFALKDFLPLQQADDDEVDIEGLAAAPDGKSLWLAGSHCQARGGIDKPTKAAEVPAWLTHIRPGPNRFLLGRIPLASGDDDGPAGTCGRGRASFGPQAFPSRTAARY